MLLTENQLYWFQVSEDNQDFILSLITFPYSKFRPVAKIKSGEVRKPPKWTFWTQKVDFLTLTLSTLLQKPHFWPFATHPPGYRMTATSAIAVVLIAIPKVIHIWMKTCSTFFVRTCENTYHIWRMSFVSGTHSALKEKKKIKHIWCAQRQASEMHV